MFAFRQVLTLRGASPAEPDVACSSVNFKGPQVQEAAFNSQTFEKVKAMPSFFKGGDALAPKAGGEGEGCPGRSGGWATNQSPQVLFPCVPLIFVYS